MTGLRVGVAGIAATTGVVLVAAWLSEREYRRVCGEVADRLRVIADRQVSAVGVPCDCTGGVR